MARQDRYLRLIAPFAALLMLLAQSLPAAALKAPAPEPRPGRAASSSASGLVAPVPELRPTWRGVETSAKSGGGKLGRAPAPDARPKGARRRPADFGPKNEVVVEAAAPRRSGTSTNRAVQRGATRQNGITFSEMNLIGVFISEKGRRALFRLENGDYVRVNQGGKVAGWTLGRVDESSVQITKGSDRQVLQVPR